VDPRKSKRLAHRIRQHARQHGLSREVHTSTLRRSADVGRWLARWGWVHHIDATLSELDFGAWDGKHWDMIGEPAVSAWCEDLASYRDHGGESVSALFDRCAKWFGRVHGPSALCVVGHAGWSNAARLLCQGSGPPRVASDWPKAPSYGERLELRWPDAALTCGP
jgi:alpha-ribazole phosphatase